MANIFILIECAGEYSDKRWNVLAASKDREKLEKLLSSIKEEEKLQNQIGEDYKNFYNSFDKEIPEVPKIKIPKPVLVKITYPPRTKEEHALRFNIKNKFNDELADWVKIYEEPWYNLNYIRTAYIHDLISKKIREKYFLSEDLVLRQNPSFQFLNYEIEEIEEL